MEQGRKLKQQQEQNEYFRLFPLRFDSIAVKQHIHLKVMLRSPSSCRIDADAHSKVCRNVFIQQRTAQIPRTNSFKMRQYENMRTENWP